MSLIKRILKALFLSEYPTPGPGGHKRPKPTSPRPSAKDVPPQSPPKASPRIVLVNRYGPNEYDEAGENTPW